MRRESESEEATYSAFSFGVERDCNFTDFFFFFLDFTQTIRENDFLDCSPSRVQIK